jgi:hypothetical protein
LYYCVLVIIFGTEKVTKGDNLVLVTFEGPDSNPAGPVLNAQIQEIWSGSVSALTLFRIILAARGNVKVEKYSIVIVDTNNVLVFQCCGAASL